MSSRVRLIIGTLVLASVAVDQAPPAWAQDGVLTPGNAMIEYTRGPFTGANPSNNLEEEPNCDLIPGTCDDFMLRVTIPTGYTEQHPDYRIVVRVGWSGANPANDFDLYIQDPVTGLSVVPPAASSANPEIASIPLADGVRDFRLRVLIFSVVNESYTGTITLGPPPAGTPGVGTYAASSDIWSCNTHLEGESGGGNPPAIFDHGQDGEPSVRFNGQGRAYVTAIAGVPAGAGVWGADDPCGQQYHFFGAPDATVGGGDSDVETAPEPNLLGNYNVYLSSLTLANITTSASFNNGQTWTLTPISTPQPVDDRQWNAAHGSSTLYLSYWQFPSGIIQVVRLDYSTLAEPIVAGPFLIGNDTGEFTRIGNLATDRRPVPIGTPPLMSGPDGQGNVYQTYINSSSQVMIGVSHDFATTWTNKLVWDGAVGVSYDHVFSWLTVDGDGNVYVAFSDDSNIYYSVSQDQGTTWSLPIRVNRGGASRTSVFPQMAAGSGGRVVFTWYGHDGTGSQDPNADWKVFTSRTQNALDPVPHFEEMIVSDRRFHTGPACQNGLGCSCCRELLECFEIDIHPTEGSSFVTYGSFGGGGTWITRQLKGESAIAGVEVPDRSGVCPVAGDCETPPPPEESVCTPPGRTVVQDVTGDVSAPGGQEQDIERVWFAEPFLGEGAEKFVISMKVSQLPADPSSLPVNTLWTVLFSVPGQQFPFFVQMNTCDPLELPAFVYGHVEGSIQLQDGSADEGMHTPDGVIQITISKNLVGSAQPGQTLTEVQGETRLLAGAACSGAITQLDASPVGTYVTRGNTYCKPPTAACPPDFEGIPADYPRDFVVTNPSTATREFNVTLDDDKGWIVGGPIQATLGPVAPGGSATLEAVIRIPGGCIDDETDPVRFAAAADDDENLNAACQTVVTCSNESSGAPEISVTRFQFDLAGSNPFHGQTSLTYALPERVPVQLDVYNVAGQRVRTLVGRVEGPGVYTVAFRAGGDGGLGSGVYWVRMHAGAFEKTLRLVALE